MNKRFLTLALTLCATFIMHGAEIKMGLTRIDGTKYNHEFVNYSPQARYFQEQGIEPALFNMRELMHGRVNFLMLYSKLKKHHVIILRTNCEGIDTYDAQEKKNAKAVGKALAMYVKKGGGLIVQISSVRYPNDEDELFWNDCLKPLGLQILHEGIHDPANSQMVKIKFNLSKSLSHTKNIKAHPVTKGVKGLLLPLHGYNNFPGTPAFKFSKDWKVIVNAEKTAKSYQNNRINNRFKPTKPGTYKSAPPVVAVRALGKGRIVAIPIAKTHTGMNYKNEFWGNQVEYKGLPGKPSNAMLLFANAVKWAAANAIKSPVFGKYKAPSHERVKYPESISIDTKTFAKPTEEPLKGTWGLHSNLTDGKGSVADYAKAAKAAGLSFIVFSEPLELLSPAKLKKLIADCKTISNDKFYACPGVEFTDGVGNRWVAWSERIKWPVKTFKKGKFTYKQWDGKVIKHAGTYLFNCGISGSALINYKKLRENGSYPENMWWFYNIIPKAYEGSKLIADNSEQMEFAHRDLRWVYPITFNRIKSPAQIKQSVKTGVTSFNNMEWTKKTLNRRGNPAHHARAAQQYITNGDIKIHWQMFNGQMESNWLYTKGAQRAKCSFTVESPAGIKSVKVIDAFGEVLRNFAGNGAKKLTKELEFSNSRKHSLWLEVTDSEGKTATSHVERVWCYKQGLYRCGDNLNILGPLGMYWHPDRNQMLPIIKKFHNAEVYSIMGWDRAQADCPTPDPRPLNMVNIEGVGIYPPYIKGITSGTRMRVDLASHDVQMVTMKMDEIMEHCDTAQRPGPAFASISRKVEDNEYFTRTDSMYAFRDNADFFTIWNYRRLREGLEKFKGSFILHEGEFKFKKDVTLNGSVPIKILKLNTPFEPGKRFNKLVVDDLERDRISIEIKVDREPKSYSGVVKPGGYLAVMNSPIGYIGFMTPHNQTLTYSFHWPGLVYVGLGKHGQKIKRGQVIKYRYIAAILTDPTDNAKQLQELVKNYNLDGGTKGYPLDVKTGKLLSAEIFLSIKADANEVKFTAGPAETVIDMPMKISGIEDNGCAAIYSSMHPWFNFVPVVKGTAILQESIAKANDIWIGNVFVAENPAIKMTLVKDGQAKGKKPFLEIHNPTGKTIKTKVYSPKNTPVFGGKSFSVTIPAGDSIKYNL
ncbi:MAG: hypothetical protein L3J71_03850 [Victivallaceae bacterium]|nr:hypothetical protein [Victivallaceae bacterium]